jgi:tetratricopeptide (TPR) repeat protein
MPVLMWPLALLALLFATRTVLRSDRGPDAAQLRAEQALSRSEWAPAAGEARIELRAQPLDGRAYRVLARVAAAQGDATTSARRLAQALHYAPRDLQTRAMAVDAALARGASAEAVAHIDAMLRMEPPLGELLFPRLVSLADTRDGREALLTHLAAQPLWRAEFMPELVRQAPAVAGLEPLMVALQARGGLGATESSAFLDRYIAERRWDEGYRVWLRLLPAKRRSDLATPTDGDFESAVTGGAPFEWRIASAAGVEAGIAPNPEGTGHGLRLAFTGSRQPYEGVRQLLLLPPGRSYVLRWRSRLESLDTPRGLRWELRCTDESDRVLLDSPPERGTRGWQNHELRFVVPAGCPAQWLRLGFAARIASENQAVGAAWWDDVAILDATPSPE